MWEVEVTNEFSDWFRMLSEEVQDQIIARIELLEERGPGLGRPTVDNVHQSKHPNMKELRSAGGIRVLFAFDPRRTAILLVGGDKSPDDPSSPHWNDWYWTYVPHADELYDTYLAELKQEGLI